MLPLFSSVTDIFKRSSHFHIHYPIFHLHCTVTAALLIASSLILTAKQYFGDPIHCLKGKFELKPDVVETYCWIHGTYVVQNDLNRPFSTQRYAYPAINSGRIPSESDKKYFFYYQWVSLVLFLQAVFFYLPQHVWKVWEGGLIDKLTRELRTDVLRGDDTDSKTMKLAKYLVENRSCHKWYTLKYLFCELLCLGNVAAQIYVMDVFLNHDFITYGLDVFKFLVSRERDVALNPFVRAFPKMTKCSFHTYGLTGSLQNAELYCILPLNIVNDKIYLILWVWLVLILSILLLLAIFFRILATFAPSVRSLILTYRMGFRKPLPRHLEKWKTKVNTFIDESDFGDCFLLLLLFKNITHAPFLREVIGTAYDLEKKYNVKTENIRI